MTLSSLYMHIRACPHSEPDSERIVGENLILGLGVCFNRGSEQLMSHSVGSLVQAAGEEVGMGRIN